ncbi:MAG: hypothetical protein K6D02_00090 [Lachnospiraceae bacterium]|nr:hypothetical protein [Lachnospiraceae bacterium]
MENDIPADFEVKYLESDPENVHIVVDKESKNLLPYIKDNALYSLANYTSKSSFSCCSYFEKCSNEGKCVHENKLYSTGCSYRRFLEVGKIFYGKNRNVN